MLRFIESAQAFAEWMGLNDSQAKEFINYFGHFLLSTVMFWSLICFSTQLAIVVPLIFYYSREKRDDEIKKKYHSTKEWHKGWNPLGWSQDGKNDLYSSIMGVLVQYSVYDFWEKFL